MIQELPITQFTPTNQTTIWDVRDVKAYAEGHLQYAQNQPLEAINAELLARFPVTEPIYVLCGGGSKAGKAATLITDLDNQREVVILTGGTRAAKAAGMKIDSDVPS